MVITETTEQIQAVHDDLSRSSFSDVNLTGSSFSNVNLTGARFASACLNSARFQDVTCVGMQFEDADLSQVSLSNCNTDTMTINGILVKDLLACFQECGQGSGGKPA